MAQYQDIAVLAEQHAEQISRSPRDWMDYLNTAAALYRYSFADTLLIHAQRPDAIACAELETWNEKMFRWVNRGARGIALLDDRGSRQRLRYVFDLTDTHPVRGARRPFLWRIRPGWEEDVARHLADVYGLETSETSLQETLTQIAFLQMQENWEEAIRGLEYELAGTDLESRDVTWIRQDFQRLVEQSARYMLLKRCGLDAMAVMEDDGFFGISAYHRLSVLAFVGNAAHEIAEPVLREVSRYLAARLLEIQRQQKEKVLASAMERNYNEFSTLKRESTLEKGEEHSETESGDHVSAEGRVLLSESDDAKGGGRDREIRDPSEAVSEGAPEELVPEHDADRETDTASERNRAERAGTAGSDRGRDGTEGRRDRAVEGGRSDGMDTADEQPEEPGGGDRTDGIGVQLISEETEVSEEVEFGETEDRDPSVFLLPEYPSVNQQIRRLQERTTALFAGDTAIPAAVLDEVIRTGSNRDKSRQRIIFHYMMERTQTENAEFLRREYGTGGKGLMINGQPYAVWFDELGMQIVEGHTVYDPLMEKAFLSWEEIAHRVRQLLAQGEYAPQEILNQAWPNALQEYAQVLVYMNRDLTEGISDIVFGDLDWFSGSFTEQVERVGEYLQNPGHRHDLVERLEGLAAAYREDHAVMRYARYNPERVLLQFQKIEQEAVAYPAREDYTEHPQSVFITQDEIDRFLAEGGPLENGRLATFAFFATHPNQEERSGFLKQQYGDGGRTHALSGADGSGADYRAKGLHLYRGLGEEPHDEIDLSWNQAAQRVAYLIRQNRFLTAEDYLRMPVYERGQIADKVMEFYRNLPLEMIRPFSEGGLQDEIQKELVDILQDPERSGELIRQMGEALSELPMTYDHEVREEELFSQVHDYLEGIYTIYADPQADQPSDQMSLFDLLSETEEATEVEDVSERQEAEIAPLEPENNVGGVESESAEKPGQEETENDRKADSEETEWNGELPLNASVFIDGREYRIDTVDYTQNRVSLQDMTMARQARYPLFRTESVSYVWGLLQEAQQQAARETDESVLEAEPADEKTVERFRSVDETGSPEEEPDPAFPERINYRITDEDLGAGGPKAKFRANMDAIYLLKTLESEGRLATAEEQDILSRYVGWGGIPQAFDESSQDWSGEFAEVRAALTDEEYQEARASTLNAFYTSPTVIQAMYEALGNMGLSRGNLLEPSCGIGNFMGLVPDSMTDVQMYGVELDSLSGRIARQLYQKNSIAIQGFETADFPENFFDCVIGNVPFGQYTVSDRKYDRHHFLIHDYFLAKSLDLIRPGGVMAVVTSSGTMDKQNPSARQYLANRADLIGAIRLPNNAFMRNANTGVVADILFFQKRDRISLNEPDWVRLGRTEEGYTVNSWFVQHPEMVLGEWSTENTQYGRQEVTVRPVKGADLKEQLTKAVSRLQAVIPELAPLTEPLEEEAETWIPADPSVRNFSFTNVQGQVYYRENSRMHRMEFSAKTTGRVLGMIALRDTTQALLQAQLEDQPDPEIIRLQQQLEEQYETFTRQYGLLNEKANQRAFSQDSSYCLLASLEILDEEGNLARKADLFTRRTIRRAEPVTSVDTASEALALSIGEKAGVDLAYMAQLTGKDEEIIVSELQGVIFKNPLTQEYETSDAYLSGNVREKLRIAKQFAENSPEYAINAEYLEKVQPKDLEASEIEARLGAPWIDAAYVTQFMGELFHTPRYYLGRDITVRYAAVNGQWNISGKNRDVQGNPLVISTYGTARANAYRLLEDALNLKDTKIYDTVQDEEGRERRVLNKKETMLAQQKQDMIREAFREWIFQDMDRREDLCRTYNELFNSIRPREYDGSHIRFVGMSPDITLRQHQKNAVAHILYGGNTLLAHCVGAGKTFQMIAAGMESKRLGLAQKCLYVVPNHLTEQWGSDFLRLYPGANILVATKKDFEPANRKKFCSRIATGEYDAIIIGHSQFEKIPLSVERQMQVIEQQIDEISYAIEASKGEEGSRYTVKQMEKTRKTLQAKLVKLNDRSRKDDVVTFEQLGVDRLFVDESHFYKNLFLYTKMKNVAGISQTDAQKSSDLFAKCRYLDEITGGRGITFATGTPISNSMVELYTIMRYLQFDTLHKMGLGHFDAWAASFGETVTAVELSPEGTGYRAKTRFARFFNLPELISIFKESADIQTADMLNLPVPEAEYINEVLKPSQEQKELVESFAKRADAVRNGRVAPSVDNMLAITNDGRKCALDQRLINDMLPDAKDSKVNRCVQNVFQIWQETKEERSTQLVFCDLSTPKADGSFNVYDDIREKLTARGIPKEEIVFIHEAATEAKKVELFAKMRSGQVRVLLGSTPKLGAGTNVQDRLIALHHLDCPWKPSDLEQQEGRILRQGNRNPKVQIFRYVTEGTFDSYMWQILENKQKFISQIMTSKSPVRACEDVDDTALSYAEIKALATGNPHIKEKMELDIQVSKLKLLKSNHTSAKYRLETDIARTYPVQIAAVKERIAGLQADLSAAKTILAQGPEQFRMVIGQQEFTDRKEAGTALMAACSALNVVKTSTGIGEYQGFALLGSFDSFFQKYQLTIRRQCSYTVEVGKDALGNIQRITNALSGIEKKLTESEQKLENLQKQLATAREEVERPFPQEAELVEKSARLTELNTMLNMDERDVSSVVGIGEETEGMEAEPVQKENRNVNLMEERDHDRVARPSVLARLKNTTQMIREKHVAREEGRSGRTSRRIDREPAR